MSPERYTIIKELSKCGSVSPSDLIDSTKEKGKMEEVIRGMISANILRYDISGNIKWNGQVQQDEFMKINGCK